MTLRPFDDHRCVRLEDAGGKEGLEDRLALLGGVGRIDEDEVEALAGGREPPDRPAGLEGEDADLGSIRETEALEKPSKGLYDPPRTIHKDVAENLKFARIWGEHVFDGQTVQREHALEDGDVVELHT